MKIKISKILIINAIFLMATVLAVNAEPIIPKKKPFISKDLLEKSKIKSQIILTGIEGTEMHASIKNLSNFTQINL